MRTQDRMRSLTLPHLRSAKEQQEKNTRPETQVSTWRKRTMGTGDKPTLKYRTGAVDITVFENKVKKDGKDIVIPSISMSRSYKDKDDKWQHTTTFRTNDLPKLQLLIGKVYAELLLGADDDE